MKPYVGIKKHCCGVRVQDKSFLMSEGRDFILSKYRFWGYYTTQSLDLVGDSSNTSQEFNFG